MDADSGQGQLFRSYLASRPAVLAMAFGASAAFVYGAWKGNVPIMLGGPAAILLAVAGIAWYSPTAPPRIASTRGSRPPWASRTPAPARC